MSSSSSSTTTTTTTKIASKPDDVTDWFETSFNFYSSPEGIAEYKKIGMEYPKTLMDYWYKQFLRVTKNTKKEDYKIYIRNMKRVILSSGEEYIVHDMDETRYDGLHNRKVFHRGGIGLYAKPVPHREIKARVSEDEGFVQDVITTVESVETGYSIPFNQKNIDKLIKYCDGNTAFIIQKMDYQSARKFTIRSLNDWQNGSTEELLRFGHIASSYEQQILADEKQGKFTHLGIPPAGGSAVYK